MQENVPLGEILEAFYFCKSWWIYSKLLTESEICITGYKFEPARSRRHHFQVIFLICQFNISSKLHFFWRAIGISCIRKHYLTTWWIYNTSKLGKASTFICYTLHNVYVLIWTKDCDRMKSHHSFIPVIWGL